MTLIISQHISIIISINTNINDIGPSVAASLFSSPCSLKRLFIFRLSFFCFLHLTIDDKITAIAIIFIAIKSLSRDLTLVMKVCMKLIICGLRYVSVIIKFIEGKPTGLPMGGTAFNLPFFVLLNNFYASLFSSGLLTFSQFLSLHSNVDIQ